MILSPIQISLSLLKSHPFFGSSFTAILNALEIFDKDTEGMEPNQDDDDETTEFEMEGDYSEDDENDDDDDGEDESGDESEFGLEEEELIDREETEDEYDDDELNFLVNQITNHYPSGF